MCLELLLITQHVPKWACVCLAQVWKRVWYENSSLTSAALLHISQHVNKEFHASHPHAKYTTICCY